MVSLTINGAEVKVPADYTVLEAAKQAGIDIPTLCYLKDVNEVGACRVCMVEVEGGRTLQASCVLPVRDGMVVKTNSKRVRTAVKANVELILANHNRECLSCTRNKSCELQSISEELGIEDVKFQGAMRDFQFDNASPSVVRDSSKCILCGKCIAVCSKVQNVGVLGFQNRGFETTVGPAFGMALDDVPCISCGQCINVCPVGALSEKNDIHKVWDAIEDTTKHVVVQTAPAVRAALGEEFGYEIGTRATGKMVAALRRLGFDKVFDTNFAADLTIMEEGTELLGRIQNGGTLPMITSCSPGWINYCEQYYPEFIDNLSSCKSPHQMMGAIVKSYYAEKQNIDPKDIFVVSIMPCVAKKQEAARPEMSVDGNQDVDVVLTTRELAKMIKQARIKYTELPDEDYDQPLLGEYTGAGVIFGATGGVMEAALRTVADILTGEDLEEIEHNELRGIEGIKEAEVKLGDITVKAAIAHGAGNASKLLEMIKSGEKEYHFIEIMGCEGGCVNGGGQPIVAASIRRDLDVRVERAKALYEEDRILPVRKSHKNVMIQALYKDYLGEPNGHTAHKLLHTHYAKQVKYK